MRLVVLASLVTVASPALAYTEVSVSDGGTLAGVVRFVGKAVSLEPMPVRRHHEVCGDEQPSDALVVGLDRGVTGGVVFVHGVTQGKKSPSDVVLDSRHCAFAPRVVATTAGARAKVKNSDPIVHSARGLLGKTTVFHVAIPGKDQEVDITRRLTRPGVVRIVSDSYPHMSAWMIVHDSPYVAVTDEQGAFRIEGIPPGSYRVSLWHEGYRRRGTDPNGRPLFEEPHTITKDVTIAPRATATVAFELK
jgi:hypothetical protein